MSDPQSEHVLSASGTGLEIASAVRKSVCRRCGPRTSSGVASRRDKRATVTTEHIPIVGMNQFCSDVRDNARTLGGASGRSLVRTYSLSALSFVFLLFASPTFTRPIVLSLITLLFIAQRDTFRPLVHVQQSVREFSSKNQQNSKQLQFQCVNRIFIHEIWSSNVIDHAVCVFGQ